MPIFVLLVFVGAALLWLLLSFGFIPIGKLSNRLLKDASDAMSKDEKDEKIDKRQAAHRVSLPVMLESFII